MNAFLHIPRAWPRVRYELPIEVATGETEAFEASKLVNYSREGLCFESPRVFRQNAQVEIRMPNHNPDEFGPEAFRSYLGDIRWCKQIRNSGAALYAVGVRFLNKSHTERVSAPSADHRCGMCGILVPDPDMMWAGEDLSLCGVCDRRFQCIPEGLIRRCIHRFLIGNVI